MTLKFQCKLQRQVWSFSWNFKEALNFDINYKEGLKFALKLQSQLWSLLWNFKGTLWSLPWNFKANFKGSLKFALKFQSKLQRNMFYLFNFSVFFQTVVGFFNYASMFFTHSLKKTKNKHAKTRGCIHMEECIARWFAQAKLFRTWERNVETYFYKHYKHQHFMVCG